MFTEPLGPGHILVEVKNCLTREHFPFQALKLSGLSSGRFRGAFWDRTPDPKLLQLEEGSRSVLFISRILLTFGRVTICRVSSSSVLD